MRSDSEFLANVKSKHENALEERRVRRKRAAYTVSALFALAVICAAVIPVITRFGDMKSNASDGGMMYEADGDPIFDNSVGYNAAPNNEDNAESLPNEAADGGVRNVEKVDPEKSTASAEKLELVGTLGDDVEIYTASAGGYVFQTDETECYVLADDLDTAIELYKKTLENETEKAG